MIRFFNLLLCCAGSAAANLHFANDPATGEPGKFAAEEIRREAALYNRVGHVNRNALTEKVAADHDLARNWKPGTLKDDDQSGGSEKRFRQ